MKTIIRFAALHVFSFLFLCGWIPAASAEITSFNYSSTTRYVDQQKIVESKMYLTRTQKSEIIRNPLDLKYMVERLTQNVKRALADLRFGHGDNRLIREQVQRKMDAVREQNRMLKQRQETLFASQKEQQREMRDRMESLARQRKDFMRFRSR